MNSRLKQWLDEKGRRLVELRVMGADGFLTGDLTSKDAEKLGPDEWVEFLTLIGQFDGLTWALQPGTKRQANAFHREIKNILAEMEKECRYIFKITGKTSIPKGRA